jgi:hypothetical protein
MIMQFRPSRAFHPFAPVLAVCVLLAACAQPAPEAPKTPEKSNAAMVAEIQAAGDRDKSVINVAPLVDPGVTALQSEARNLERSSIRRSSKVTTRPTCCRTAPSWRST